jgi:FecR protein
MGCGLWLTQSPRTPAVARNGWDVQVSSASQQSESSDTRVASKSERLELGETLETEAATKASVAVAEIGRIEVEPMTRLRLLQSGTGRKRIALDRGTIHATIWAPPGQFVVDTPSAVAVDLGCMYTLHIDDSGSGILHTTLGWVGFHRDGHESFIPAGAACPTHVQSGPGTPYFEDASDAFRSALAQLDSPDIAPSVRKSALGIVLRAARERDAFTLWHLLPRVTDSERPTVYDRLAALVPPPLAVTREGILRLDTTMLDACWNAFDLGDISLWRHWEQSWTGREGQSK